MNQNDTRFWVLVALLILVFSLLFMVFGTFYESPEETVQPLYQSKSPYTSKQILTSAEAIQNNTSNRFITPLSSIRASRGTSLVPPTTTPPTAPGATCPQPGNYYSAGDIPVQSNGTVGPIPSNNAFDVFKFWLVQIGENYPPPFTSSDKQALSSRTDPNITNTTSVLSTAENQSSCGSCWAFSTSTAISDRYRVFVYKLLLQASGQSPSYPSRSNAFVIPPTFDSLITANPSLLVHTASGQQAKTVPTNLTRHKQVFYFQMYCYKQQASQPSFITPMMFEFDPPGLPVGLTDRLTRFVRSINSTILRPNNTPVFINASNAQQIGDALQQAICSYDGSTQCQTITDPNGNTYTINAQLNADLKSLNDYIRTTIVAPAYRPQFNADFPEFTTGFNPNLQIDLFSIVGITADSTNVSNAYTPGFQIVSSNGNYSLFAKNYQILVETNPVFQITGNGVDRPVNMEMYLGIWSLPNNFNPLYQWVDPQGNPYNFLFDITNIPNSMNDLVNVTNGQGVRNVPSFTPVAYFNSISPYAFSSCCTLGAVANTTGGCQTGQNTAGQNATVPCLGSTLDSSYAYITSQGAITSIENYQDYYQYLCPQGTLSEASKLFKPTCIRNINADSTLTLSQQVANIINDLIEFGPLSFGMQVYPSFMQTNSSQYVTSNGELLYLGQASGEQAEGGHAMVLTGWGYSPQYGSYWRVRNSWTADWANSGFVNILMGATGLEGYVFGAYYF